MAPFSLRALSAHRSQGVSSMSGVGQRFPQFSLTGVVSSDVTHAFQSFSQDSFPGKWRGGFFLPKDFTLLCPPQIPALRRLEQEVRARGAQLLGGSGRNEDQHPPPRRGEEGLGR